MLPASMRPLAGSTQPTQIAALLMAPIAIDVVHVGSRIGMADPADRLLLDDQRTDRLPVTADVVAALFRVVIWTDRGQGMGLAATCHLSRARTTRHDTYSSRLAHSLPQIEKGPFPRSLCLVRGPRAGAQVWYL